MVLVRDTSKKLVGVQVIYRDCANDAARKRQLREGLERELNVKTDSEPPYVVWPDHSLVRLADRKDGTCALTVAGPVFGKPYADQLLHEGLGELGNAMRPHWLPVSSELRKAWVLSVVPPRYHHTMMLKIGDVVVLRSGSVPMTVIEVHPASAGGNVVCSWMDKAGKDHVQAWPSDALQPHSDGPVLLGFL